MKSWDRLFSFDLKKLKNTIFSINKNIQSSRTSSKLIVASTSIVSATACLYYVNEYKNKKTNLLIAKTFDDLNDDLRLYEKRKVCNRLIQRYKEEFGIPGVIVGVSQNGRIIYEKGFGYSDVENNVRAHAHTVMRIASISKPITCTLAARLFQDGKLDLDKPVTFYLNDLPSLKWNNRQVTITSRQLMSHTSGIRHYEKFKTNEKSSTSTATKSDNTQNDLIDDVGNDKSYKKLYPIKFTETSGDSLFSEFFLNKPFKSTRDALELFIHDELRFEPGKGYLYSTYGYTLLSAVLEQCNGPNSKFSNMLINFFQELDMNETYLDYNTPLVANRSKYYLRNEKKALINVPYVDNSYKWAGGGILSTVGDLIKYGNHLLKSYDDKNKNTYLKSSTLKSYVWSPQSQPPHDESPYGLGWHLKYNTNKQLKYVYHTGGAVGATTCLLIVPSSNHDTNNDDQVNGLVVSVLCNSQDTRDIVKFSLRISDIFLQD